MPLWGYPTEFQYRAFHHVSRTALSRRIAHVLPVRLERVAATRSTGLHHAISMRSQPGGRDAVWSAHNCFCARALHESAGGQGGVAGFVVERHVARAHRHVASEHQEGPRQIDSETPGIPECVVKPGTTSYPPLFPDITEAGPPSVATAILRITRSSHHGRHSEVVEARIAAT
jgi:hypothetical protein